MDAIKALQNLEHFLFFDGVNEDLHPIVRYLLNDIAVSRRELVVLKEERSELHSDEHKALLEEIDSMIARSLVQAGADPKQVESDLLELDEDDQDEHLVYQITHHLRRIERCHDLLEQMEDGKLTLCLTYFEERLAYRRDVEKQFRQTLPKFKIDPALKERSDAHERTLERFITLLKGKINPAPP